MDQTSEQRRQFDVDAMVDEVLMVMSPTLRRTRHKLSTEVALGIAMDSFPGPLEQVLVNFINNALLHAFVDEQAGHMQIQATLHGQEVKIVFSDNGCGMDEDTQKRAFDPFFTTRLGQGGNGLGLHLAYNIVTSLLGGRIELASALGKGTTFTLYLPQVAPLTEPSTV
jgi:signal transduction histidine kinase